MTISVESIKKLREATGAPVVRVKKLLDELKGDEAKALEILTKEGFEKVAKRADRATTEGKIGSYIHHTGKVACIVELLCETDFVSRNELFEELAKNVALHIASMNPKDTEELLSQDFIKDPSKTIEDLVKDVIVKTGENIQIGRFSRIEIGK